MRPCVWRAKKLNCISAGIVSNAGVPMMSESDGKSQVPPPGEVARFEEPMNISFRKVDRTPKGKPSAFVCDSPDE